MVTTSDPFCSNVSVIVLNYNQAATTVECLDALAHARSDLIREIILVDNGSAAEELAILRLRHAQGDFILLEVGENRFFGEGNNIGVDAAGGDYIVFLNNDAFVQPGWIEALSTTMRDPYVAAVGPLFLYPDGRVQEVEHWPCRPATWSKWGRGPCGDRTTTTHPTRWISARRPAS